MFDLIGNSVVKLRRVSIGHINDKFLKVGAYRLLSPQEVKDFQNPPKKALTKSTLHQSQLKPGNLPTRKPKR